jgi:hypothetical protein
MEFSTVGHTVTILSISIIFFRNVILMHEMHEMVEATHAQYRNKISAGKNGMDRIVVVWQKCWFRALKLNDPIEKHYSSNLMVPDSESALQN